MSWQPDPEGWRRSYDQDGYLVVENVVDSGLLGQMREALGRIECAVAEDTLPPQLRRWITLERERTDTAAAGVAGSDVISNIMEVPLFDPVFRDLIIYPRVLDILEALFESTEFSFHNYKCICKMPGGQAAFQWHRDLPYLEHTSPNLITCMLCIDAMTAENGGTVVCPGSHSIPYDAVRPEDKDLPESEVPADRVTVECPAGSAVLFHINLLHGGGPNLTRSARRNVIGIWAGPDTYPTTGGRYAYEFVRPRSKDPELQRQVQMTFGQERGEEAT